MSTKGSHFASDRNSTYSVYRDQYFRYGWFSSGFRKFLTTPLIGGRGGSGGNEGEGGRGSGPQVEMDTDGKGHVSGPFLCAMDKQMI
jgi:hypothetical protein